MKRSIFIVFAIIFTLFLFFFYNADVYAYTDVSKTIVKSVCNCRVSYYYDGNCFIVTVSPKSSYWTELTSVYLSDTYGYTRFSQQEDGFYVASIDHAGSFTMETAGWYNSYYRDLDEAFSIDFMTKDYPESSVDFSTSFYIYGMKGQYDYSYNYKGHKCLIYRSDDNNKKGDLYKSIIDPWFNQKISLNEVGFYTIDIVYVSASWGVEDRIVETFSICITNGLRGIKNNAEYYGLISFSIDNNGANYYLDGVELSASSHKLSEIGNHRIRIIHDEKEELIDFVLHPSGLEQYISSDLFSGYSPAILDANIVLDGYQYNSIDRITMPGEHELLITGKNNYKFEKKFTVLPIVSGINNGEELEDFASLNFSGGTATLDNNAYNSGDIINEIGNHTIILAGINNYKQEISFSIVPSIFNEISLKQYLLSFSINLPEYKLFLDEEEYISNSSIEEIGNHSISIIGCNDYVKTINFIIEPSINNIVESTEYDGSVTPTIEGGTITLDGKEYDGISVINEPGTHQIKITGINDYSKTIDFNVNLISSGIDDKEVLTSKGSLTFSGGTATLDDEPYSSGTEINIIGNHTIVILGSNDFSKAYNFTIEPSIKNIAESTEYEGSVTPTIEGGTITLDGKEYDGASIINEPGTHEIKITGTNNYEKKLVFSIKLITSGISDGDKLISKGSFTFSGGKATLDGEEYLSNTVIDIIGNHTIVILGSNSFSKTYNFTIEPSIKNIVESAEYDGSVAPTIEGGTITLDGIEYDGKSTINEPGTHEIRITGSNKYEKKISFKIKLIDSNLNNTSNYDVVSYQFSGGQAALDGNNYLSNTEIRNVGKHQIVVNGSNGYSKVINFEIKPIDYTVVKTDNSFKITINKIHPDTKVEIDGIEINDSYNESLIGNHTLIITSNNDYSETITYTVAENFESKTVYSPYELDATKYSANVYVDGVLIQDNYRLDENKTYVLTFEGTNGYSNEYTITYVNSNYTYAYLLLIPVSISLIAIVIFVIKRRRVI